MTWDFQQCGILTSVDSDVPAVPFYSQELQMMVSQHLKDHRIFKRLAKALIRLCICAGWSEALLVAHTTLMEIPSRSSFAFCLLIHVGSLYCSQCIREYHQMRKLMTSFILNGRKNVWSCLILGLGSAVGNVSGCRYMSDCTFRGPEFDPGPVPYFRGDWSWNNFYGHSPPFRGFKKGCCQLQAKVCARSTGQLLI